MEAEVHRALGDGRRQRLLEELRGERDGLDVHELASRIGLHQNTVRWHLGVLAEAGVVESQPAARSLPGRPRILYRLSRSASAPAREEYRLLATILAGSAAERDGGAAAADQAGREWGRYLVRKPLPLARVSEEEAVGEVVRLLDEQGFEPDADGTEVRMHRCPFHDLAEQYPSVVCAVHRGLVSGALEELGSGLEVGELAVFVEPDLCVARLQRSLKP